MNIDELKRLLAYDEITGVFTWLVSTSNRVKVGSKAGTVRPDGYVCIKINGKLYYAHRLAWLYTHNEWPQETIDHIDGDPSNNTITNLRCASYTQNLANRGVLSTNTSGYKGVYFDDKRALYVANICIKGKTIYLGAFDTAEEASQKFKQRQKELYGEFCYAE